MTARIAVRLDDEALSFLDRLVTEHAAESRADAVRQAVRLLRKHEEDRARSTCCGR